MKTPLLLISCILALPLFGQNTPSQPRPRPIARPVEAQTSSNSEGLKQNITIRLEGNTTTGAKVDLSLTGAGPRFTANQVFGDENLLKCEYLVSQVEAGYKVAYTVSVQVKVKSESQPNQSSNNYQYRDSFITGEALFNPNEPLVVVKNDDKQLSLSIIEGKKESDDSSAPQPDRK